MTIAFDDVGFLGFDTYGTVVDWRSGISCAAEPFLRKHGIDVDPTDFADQWRALYQPAMEKVRNGERSFSFGKRLAPDARDHLVFIIKA